MNHIVKSLKIAGFQKFSLIDYPGYISAIIFTQGCNFRCPWCHNAELVLPEQYEKDLEIPSILSFLQKRAGKLDAVTITGGEPTLHPDLPAFIQTIKSMGYKIKLDSNGSNPEMLKRIIDKGLVDYLAMDIKAPLEKYAVLTACPINTEHIIQSINLIKHSGLDYEFRTTFIPDLMEESDIYQIHRMLGKVKHYYIQHFESKKTLVTDFQAVTQNQEVVWNRIMEYSKEYPCVHYR
ncbi:MAG: anaerobic ribonucleoside-triphosphate reductase activating protein [Candidatus Cloacimonetes bacterium]|nr:anaerobic ribonucleoside-triphosphate reductase activating protein [Candidatus Cloacimonadota bacterium]